MSGPDFGTGTERSEPKTRSPSRRVVISSVTGKPIDWEPESDDRGTSSTSSTSSSSAQRPILPDRVREDEPEPGADESNDSRLSGDVPPHWGRGN